MKATILVLSLVATACLAIYSCANKLWMIVYLEEAVVNSFHPICPTLPPGTIPVVPRGNDLSAKTKLAELQVESLTDQTRRYRWRTKPGQAWNEQTVTLKGGFGRNLSLPGNQAEDLGTFFGWKHNVIAFEGEKSFNGDEELALWLRYFKQTYGAVYTRAGLVVGCLPENPNFQIIQIKLKGQRPRDLKGAQDSEIHLVPASK